MPYRTGTAICRTRFTIFINCMASQKYRFSKLYYVPPTPCRRNFKTEVLLWKRIKCSPSTLRRTNLKTENSLRKSIECFPSTLRRRNLKTEQSRAILDLCLRKIRAGKSHDYRNVIVFEKLRFQNILSSQENQKPAFLNSSGLTSAFRKLRSRDRLL